MFPRALADENGIPHRSLNIHWTNKLKARYEAAAPPIFSNQLRMVPDVVIIYGTFLVTNTKPLRNTNTISEYAKLIFNCFIKEHYNSGVLEVHLIFDMPYLNNFNPKQFKQLKNMNQKHKHVSFEPASTIKLSWQDIMKCDTCKQSLVEAIGLSFFQLGRFLVCNNQKLIVAGCYNDYIAWVIQNGETTVPQPEPRYKSSAEEASMRIWRDAFMCQARNILIYSPDIEADICNVGLAVSTTTSRPTMKQFVIQFNIPSSQEKKYINLNYFITALKNDAHLACLPQESLARIMVSLHVSTGTDFTSYF